MIFGRVPDLLAFGGVASARAYAYMAIFLTVMA